MYWYKYSCVLWFFWNWGIEYILQQVLNKIRDKSITHNVFRMWDNEPIMCVFYCIGFIECMLAGEKHKKARKYLNSAESLLILSSIITGCVSISAFASLVCLPVGIMSSAVGIKICAITPGIKNYKSIIKKKKKKRDKIVLLGKTKLDTIEVIISKALTDSDISHDEFASESYEMKTSVECTI